MNETKLENFSVGNYKAGNSVKIIVWFIFNTLFLKNHLPIPVFFKIWILRLFGAKIGKGLMIKPGVNIKYPWFLTIGNHSWIGENAWIDNLTDVNIGDNVCISQGALLLTGNHNYKKPTFDLMASPITLENGTWIGAKAVVCPGVTAHSHSILTVGSVGSKNLDAYGIYQGNPAVFVRKRDL